MGTEADRPGYPAGDDRAAAGWVRRQARELVVALTGRADPRDINTAERVMAGAVGLAERAARDAGRREAFAAVGGPDKDAAQAEANRRAAARWVESGSLAHTDGG